MIAVTLRSSPTEPAAKPLITASQPAPAPAVTQLVSAAAGKDLQVAQRALAAKNYDDALAALDKVKVNPGKNEYDLYVMNQFYFNAYVALRRFQDAEPPLEALLNSRYLKPDLQMKFEMAAAYVNYQIKDYDKTIEFGGRAIRQGSSNPQLFTAVAQAYYVKGDWAGAQRIEENVVNNQIRAGTIPEKVSLQLWESACSKLGGNVCLRQAVEKLNAYYPSPQYQRMLEELRTTR
ncbi:MAG TPA: hypothetical protein VGV09_14490 [Steroidobacteraceae bacterium]|nr:hypothetical protein [Steroidobacteraceae bacterium]